jgi:RNA polymerase sigma factor (TIGR02999 family)
MTEPQPHDVTILLHAIAQGDRKASGELLPLVYEELRRLAATYMSREGVGQTLQATALVHEAYLRLIGTEDPGWDNRGHFFGAAAQAMRRILVDRARRRGRIRHGGENRRVELDERAVAGDGPSIDMLALDEALTRLEALDERKAKVVMLRYFAGLGIEETAQALAVSPATVKNEWAFARAWLQKELAGDDD